MTKIKLCGLSRPCDVEAANALKPDYIGFVFAPNRKRTITVETAEALKQQLSPDISAVGVFIDEDVETVAYLLNRGIIDVAQLHGSEDDAYIEQLRRASSKPIIRAFQITGPETLAQAETSTADYVLLDSGTGTGRTFDWDFIQNIQRPYFLAGGLTIENVGEALRRLHPFAVDVSSGIETNGLKDPEKMTAFVSAVRKEARL